MIWGNKVRLVEHDDQFVAIQESGQPLFADLCLRTSGIENKDLHVGGANNGMRHANRLHFDRTGVVPQPGGVGEDDRDAVDGNRVRQGSDQPFSVTTG